MTPFSTIEALTRYTLEMLRMREFYNEQEDEMRPCDCISQDDVISKLDAAGISFNDCSITVSPLVVVLRNGPGQLTFNMKLFQRFCEWYLEDQK